MATTRKSTKQSKATSQGGGANRLGAPGQAVVLAADVQAAASVSTLGLIQKARLANQKRMVTLTVAAYGKNSTQADAATRAVAATTAASARLAMLSQQTSTPSPTVAATGWALQGRVYSSDLAPAAGYAVFLVDAQKTYLGDFGFAYTDATGYFLISYGGPAANKTASGAPGAGAGVSAGDAATGEKGARATASSAPSASTSESMFIQIADPKGNPVFLSETAFVPVVGQACYQVITLPTGGAKLGKPPAALRSVALPPALRKK